MIRFVRYPVLKAKIKWLYCKRSIITFGIGMLMGSGLMLIYLRGQSVTHTQQFQSGPRPSSCQLLDDSVIKLYRSQVSERKIELDKINETTILRYFYPMLVPEVFCPNKVRLGTVQDGGKWVCSPHLLKSDGKECAIYALGLNDEISFEVAIQQFTASRCALRGIDVRENSLETIQTLEQNNGVFLKAFVGTKESMQNNPFVDQSLQNNPKRTTLQALTLKEIMDRFGDKSIEILKMDIEGGEVDIADEIFALSPCQVLMEIHLLKAYKIYKFLQQFSRNGYFLFETEANPLRLDMREYNFIHTNCLAKYGVSIVLGKYLS